MGVACTSPKSGGPTILDGLKNKPGWRKTSARIRGFPSRNYLRFGVLSLLLFMVVINAVTDVVSDGPSHGAVWSSINLSVKCSNVTE